MTSSTHSIQEHSLSKLYRKYHLRSRIRQFTLFSISTIVALILCVPLIYMFASSFKLDAEMYVVPPTFFPKQWSLRGYELLFQATNVLVTFRNSVIVSMVASFLGVVFSIGLCYTITRFRFPGMRSFTYLILFVYTLPAILLMIPIYSVWSQLGLLSGLAPLAITYVSITLPFAVWMLRSYFAGIPIDLEEAALVDGASRIQAFLLIILPLARPGIIATFIFTVILSWNEVLYATVFASSIDNQVISSALAAMLAESGGWMSWSMVNAFGVVATVPVLVVFVFIQRQLITGFTAGAVKG